MQLNINLADREEIAAGHALLAAILGGAIANMHTPASGYVPTPAQPTVASLVPQPTSVIAPVDNPATGTPLAAEAFAGLALPGVTPLPLPGLTPAPSTAGAVPLSIAPGGLPGTLPATLPGMPAPAAHIAPEVHALQHAQIAAAAGGTNHASGVEVDKDGYPWDERIHSGTKSKKADGTWTVKRGTQETYLNQVRAELTHRMTQGGVTAATPLPGVAPTVAPLAQSSPALTPLPLGPTASPSEPPATFEALMMRTSPAVVAGTLPADALQRVCAALGLPNIVALQTNPQFVPQAWATIKQHWPAVQ